MWSRAALLSNGFLMRESERERGAGRGAVLRSGGEISVVLLRALTLSLCVRPCEAVCAACVCACLHYLTDPLLHFEPSPSSVSLSGERRNDTFVALNKRRGSSHAVSTRSGSRVGGRCCGGKGGGVGQGPAL